jgi:uncharacterized membrane protein YfcA
MTVPDESPRRPSSITALALFVILVGVLAALTGIGLSAVSACCGSSHPDNPAPTLVGLIVAVAMCAAGVGLWSGRASRGQVLTAVAAVPAAILAASPWSSDFSQLLPLVVGGWIWLWWYLRRSRPARWLSRT